MKNFNNELEKLKKEFDDSEENISVEQLKEYIMLKQAKDIRTLKNYMIEQGDNIRRINNCVLFFTICFVVSIVLGIFIFIATLIS